MTKTQERVEYLGTCLKKGMSRPEAAKALSKHDKRVSHGYAVTLVYQIFSGTEYAVRKPPTAKKKVAAKPKVASKKAPVKKVITKVKSKAPVKKAVVKKPAAKRPIAKKPAAKRPVAKKAAKPVAKKATKPVVKKAPIKEKSFKQKALDEAQESSKPSPKKKRDRGDTPETRATVKSSKKPVPAKKKTSTPVSRKKKVTEGSELVF